jgi:hypothetical protein
MAWERREGRFVEGAHVFDKVLDKVLDKVSDEEGRIVSLGWALDG